MSCYVGVLDLLTRTRWTTEINLPGPKVDPQRLNDLLRLARENCGGDDFLVLTGSLPPGCPEDTYAQLVSALRVPCVVDASGGSLRTSLKAGPFLVKPNRAELAGALDERAHPVEFRAAVVEHRHDGARGELLLYGSGWGALENLRREKAGLSPVCAHLDFGRAGQEQSAFVTLLEKGSFGEQDTSAVPAAWIRQKEWTRLMLDAVQGPDSENWYTLLQLGCLYLCEPDIMRAEHYITRSLKARKSAWGLYALAELKRVTGDAKGCALTMLEASSLAPQDPNLAKMTARHLHAAKMYEEQIAFVKGCDGAIQALPRMRLYLAFALAMTGSEEEALVILENGGAYLEIPDIQEGEISLSELWYVIQEKLAARQGRAFDRADARPPRELDFRMFVE